MRASWITGTGLAAAVLVLSACAREDAGATTAEHARKTALTLFVVRHAESYRSVKPRPDFPAEKLDSLTPNGRAAAAAVGAVLKGKGVAAVVASPTGRTRQTAAAIAAALGLGKPAEDAVFLPVRDEQALARVLAAVSALARKHAGRAVVVVTHGPTCAALIKKASGAPQSVNTGSISEIVVTPGGWKLARAGWVPPVQ